MNLYNHFSISFAIALATTAAAAAAAAFGPNEPALCVLSPALALAAGDTIKASVNAMQLQGSTCEATISFTNDTFLPVQFEFRPSSCINQEVEIVIPMEVPDGEAFLLWQVKRLSAMHRCDVADDDYYRSCTGDPVYSCLRMVLTDGLSEAANLVLQQTAALACPSTSSSATRLQNFTQASISASSITTNRNTSMTTSTNTDAISHVVQMLTSRSASTTGPISAKTPLNATPLSNSSPTPTTFITQKPTFSPSSCSCAISSASGKSLSKVLISLDTFGFGSSTNVTLEAPQTTCSC